MARSGRVPQDYNPTPQNSRLGAVLIALFPGPEGLMLPCIFRPEDGTVHAGQVALPGGGREGNEEYPTRTALREAHEEIGLHPEGVDVLGFLSPLYIPVSNYSVTPVVGFLPQTPKLTPNPWEVSGVLFVSIQELHGSEDLDSFRTSNGAVQDAPCYRVAEGTIWGATAMILRELVEVYESVG
jgi:8-oxo-dGTP pyrophosphatase MutT (NUDIX family)